MSLLQTFVLSKGEITNGLDSIRQWVHGDFDQQFDPKTYTRKFMVFRPSTPTFDIILLVGEVVQDIYKYSRREDSYYHAEIAVAGQNQFDDYNQAGGGRLSCLFNEFSRNKWTFCFGGRSMELGVFSPILAMHGHELSKQLGTAVKFSYEDTFSAR